MEYYLYRNGKTYLACVFADGDHLTEARAYLVKLRASCPNDQWFMEDEDGIEVRPT